MADKVSQNAAAPDQLDVLRDHFSALKGVNNMEQWLSYLKQVYGLYGQRTVSGVRDLVRDSLQVFVSAFIDRKEAREDPRFVRTAFRYARLFRDPKKLLEYFNRHRLDGSNIEYVVELAWLQLYHLHDRQAAKKTLETGLDHFQGAAEQKRIREHLRLVEQLDPMWTAPQSAAPVQTVLKEETSAKEGIDYMLRRTPGHLTVEEQRVYDRLFDEFQEQKKAWLAKGHINPYLMMATNKTILSWALHALNPRHQLQVYYEYKQEVVQTEPFPIPTVEQLGLSFVEYCDEVPQKIVVGDTLAFRTEFSQNQLTMQKQLGEGGFGKVFKAELLQNRQTFSVAAKFFVREKDQHQRAYCVSGSYVRELYAMAALQRRLQADPLEQFESPFTKLFCGLVGSRTGNGVLIMQFIRGESLYDVARQQSQNLPESLIFQYVMQMLRATKTLHSCDMLHADIKLDNWILDGRGDLTLCDFGKAIDLLLFVPQGADRALYFDYHTLNSVCPTPSCRPTYLFQADFAGLAGCLFTLLERRLLQEADLREEDRAGTPWVTPLLQLRGYTRGAVLRVLLERLLNFRSKGLYQEAKAAAIEEFNALIALCQGTGK